MPIDPHRADAGRVRTRDVACERVTQHHCLIGVRADPVERGLEDPPIRLPEPELARNHDRPEVAREGGSRKLLALDVRRAVRDQRKSMVSGKGAQKCVGFGIDELSPPSHGPVGLGDLHREGFVRDAYRSERFTPHGRAKAGDEVVQGQQLSVFAAKLSPESFAPPDTHAIGVGENRRFLPQLLRHERQRCEQRVRGRVGTSRGDSAGGPHSGEGRLVFHDEGVVEIEEDRLRAHRIAYRRADV